LLECIISHFAVSYRVFAALPVIFDATPVLTSWLGADGLVRVKP
jgi:hypothetical protein